MLNGSNGFCHKKKIGFTGLTLTLELGELFEGEERHIFIQRDSNTFIYVRRRVGMIVNMSAKVQVD